MNNHTSQITRTWRKYETLTGKPYEKGTVRGNVLGDEGGRHEI
tara:strand:- start:157 stop:285 length:129 start_codon:yes stop_codon:yes gene_type:complete